MKLKLKELNPNPFKKEINKGKLDKEQVNKIKSNIKELGLMGSLPVFKRDNKYYLIAGHHRVQALKETYGNDYEIEVVVHNYNDDQILRGMVIENLSQRQDEFHEVVENLVAVRKYLNDNPKALHLLRESRSRVNHKTKLDTNEYKNKATASDISQWLGTVISHDKITDCLNIKDNLDPELFKQVNNTQKKGSKEREEYLQETPAKHLARIKDKKEQKELAEVLKNSKEQRVREQGKLLTQYKESSDEVKQKVRDGEIDLTEIPIEKLKEDLRKRIEDEKKENKGKIIVTHYKQYEREAGNRIGKTNGEILQTCAYLNGLDENNLLFQLDWKEMLKILETGTTTSKNYNKFMEKILNKIQ